MGKAKLTYQQVVDILADTKHTYYVLARKFGVSHSTIAAIKRRTKWKSIKIPHYPRYKRGIPKNRRDIDAPQGESHWNARLTETEVRAILADQERSNKELAAEYGVLPNTIVKIKSKKLWKHIQL